MKVVFLDIDGVLNTRAWVEDLGRARGVAHLDPAACVRVQRLCEGSGAKLVISSTWRFIHKRAAISDMFHASGLTTAVVGMTTALHTMRGLEIQAWLDASPGIAALGTVDGIVILDDDFEMEHLAPWHVKTDVDRGFTDAELRQASEVLSRPAPIIGSARGPRDPRRSDPCAAPSRGRS